jgi:hypothetical protein
MNRHVYEFNGNTGVKKIVVLMKMIFGYFRNDENRSIVTLFPGISFPYNEYLNDVLPDINIIVFTINLLVRVKTIVSLDLSNWVSNETFRSDFLLAHLVG